MDIREHIISNFKNCTTDEIKESIIEAINESDEVTLPGIGVLFEILWKNFKDKDSLLEAIKKGL